MPAIYGPHTDRPPTVLGRRRRSCLNQASLDDASDSQLGGGVPSLSINAPRDDGTPINQATPRKRRRTQDPRLLPDDVANDKHFTSHPAQFACSSPIPSQHGLASIRNQNGPAPSVTASPSKTPSVLRFGQHLTKSLRPGKVWHGVSALWKHQSPSKRDIPSRRSTRSTTTLATNAPSACSADSQSSSRHSSARTKTANPGPTSTTDNATYDGQAGNYIGSHGNVDGKDAPQTSSGVPSRALRTAQSTPFLRHLQSRHHLRRSASRPQLNSTDAKVLKSRPSRKDLQKRQRLVDKIEQLEAQLSQARQDLGKSSGECSRAITAPVVSANHEKQPQISNEPSPQSLNPGKTRKKRIGSTPVRPNSAADRRKASSASSQSHLRSRKSDRIASSVTAKRQGTANLDALLQAPGQTPAVAAPLVNGSNASVMTTQVPEMISVSGKTTAKAKPHTKQGFSGIADQERSMRCEVPATDSVAPHESADTTLQTSVANVASPTSALPTRAKSIRTPPASRKPSRTRDRSALSPEETRVLQPIQPRTRIPRRRSSKRFDSSLSTTPAAAPQSTPGISKAARTIGPDSNPVAIYVDKANRPAGKRQIAMDEEWKGWDDDVF